MSIRQIVAQTGAADEQPSTERPHRLLAVLALVRAPVLLVGLAATLSFAPARGFVLEHLVDPDALTLRAIELGGTPLSRFLAFVVLALGLLAAASVLFRRIEARWGYAAAAAMIVTGMLLALLAAGVSMRITVLLLLLGVTNLLPDEFVARLLARLPGRPTAGWLMSRGVMLAEVLRFRQFAEWVARLWTGQRSQPLPLAAAMLLPVIGTSAAIAAALPSARLVAVEQGLRSALSTERIAEGNFNWIEFDRTGRRLLATGHGIDRLIRLDFETGSVSEALVSTGHAQGFAYDRTQGSIFVYHIGERRILVLDDETLTLERAIDVPGLSPGDPWISVDAASRSIAIVSEADDRSGMPFLVLDRDTGDVKAALPLDAGNVLQLPGNRIALSFFRRTNRLVVFDFETLSIAADVTAPDRADRMAYDPATDEILLTLPARSEIVRYDAATLAVKGTFRTILGGRTLALDARRRLLLCGSLVTGEIAIIDLTTSRTLFRTYVAPWLRTLQIDEEQGLAYASANGGIYRLRYASGP